MRGRKRTKHKKERIRAKLKITALITIIIAIAVLPIAFTAYREFYVKPFLLSKPEWMRPYINPEAFFSTGYGVFTVIVWVSLGVLWMVEAVNKIRLRRLKNITERRKV